MRIKLLNISVLLILLIPRQIFSQGLCTSPLPPELTSVSVQPQTGYTDFEWKPSTSSDVAAYLIYIYHNENGIPRGDIIDTIWDPSTTRYTYKSSVSGYYSVSFVMSAFRTPNCTSPFSNIISTVFTTSAIDTCGKKISISWNPYISVPKHVTGYSLLYAENGGSYVEVANPGSDITNYILTQFTSNVQCCFVIRANLEDGSYSSSNKTCLSTKMQRPPDWINADYATFDEKNTINISFTIDPLSRINTYRLERLTEGESSFSTLAQEVSADRHLVFPDKSADPAKQNFYRLLAINNCGNSILSSNIANNIVTKIESDANKIKLRWNSVKYWRGENSGYKVFMDTGTGFREEVSIPSSDTSCSVSYSSLMYDVSGGSICFYVGAFERNNPYSISGETYSPRVCTDIIERITVPNTFTPNNDLKNDLFIPVMSFTPAEYHIVITDRQNKVLFDSRESDMAWDGRYQGSLLPDGVYLWFLKVKSPSGRTFSKTGTVTIIK